jgi:hypothetical protein
MNESQIIRTLSKKYGLTERETLLYYEIYWKRYVLNRLNSLQYDAVEVLNLGVFVPKNKTIRFLLHRFFHIRRNLKNSSVKDTLPGKGKIETLENNLRKLVKMKRLIFDALEKKRKNNELPKRNN